MIVVLVAIEGTGVIVLARKTVGVVGTLQIHVVAIVATIAPNELQSDGDTVGTVRLDFDVAIDASPVVIEIIVLLIALVAQQLRVRTVTIKASQNPIVGIVRTQVTDVAFQVVAYLAALAILCAVALSTIGDLASETLIDN